MNCSKCKVNPSKVWHQSMLNDPIALCTKCHAETLEKLYRETYDKAWYANYGINIDGIHCDSTGCRFR